MKTRILFFLILAFISNCFASNNTYGTILPTSIKIRVIDINQNTVEGVVVTLYGNEKDYRAKENPLSESKITNRHGIVVFKKLKPQAYFVHAVKGNTSNAGEEVLTEKLFEGRINKVTTLISND